MRGNYANLSAKLKAALPARALSDCARSIGFIKRLRDLRAGPFLWALILSRFSAGTPGFAQAGAVYTQLTGRRLRRRPFQMRLKSAAAVALCARAFKRMVEPWLGGQRPSVCHPLARWFADIVLIDSTIVHVNDSLKQTFKGLRTAIASMKVTLALSAFGALPLDVRLSSGTKNDAKLFPSLRLFRPTSLLLFDRGFVVFNILRNIDRHGLYYVCSLKRNTNAVILKAYNAPSKVKRRLKTTKRLKLRAILKAGAKTRRIWDFDVALRTNDSYCSRRPITARLIIVPGPDGTQYGYLTNLPRCWTPQCVRELYRLRWQIELAFKELKQNLNLTSVPTRDKHAVQVFVWASFMALALSRMVNDSVAPCRFPGHAAQLRPALISRRLGEVIALFASALKAPALLTLLLRDLRRAATVDASERRRSDSWARLRQTAPKYAIPGP